MHYLVLIALGLCYMVVQANDALPHNIGHIQADPVADASARLIFSRDNNAPNACDVELYINQNVVAKLGPGDHISLDLPSGELSVAVALSPDGYCAGNGPDASQSIILRPGETRRLAIMAEPDQVFVAPLND